MKINMISNDLITKIMNDEIRIDNFTDSYILSHKLKDRKIMDYYMSNYFNDFNINGEDRLKKTMDIIKNNKDKINLMNTIQIDKYLKKILDTLKLDNNFLDYLIINAFVGFNTCEGFTMTSGSYSYINFAIEKCFVEQDIEAFVSGLIVHETSHVIREHYHLITHNSFDQMLMEEGMACLLTSIALDTDDPNYIFPKGIIIKDDFHNIVNYYLRNMDIVGKDTVSNLIYLGDSKAGINPGTGYRVGYSLLENLLKHDSYNMDELFWFDNKKLACLCKEKWRGL